MRSGESVRLRRIQPGWYETRDGDHEVRQVGSHEWQVNVLPSHSWETTEPTLAAARRYLSPAPAVDYSWADEAAAAQAAAPAETAPGAPEPLEALAQAMVALDVALEAVEEVQRAALVEMDATLKDSSVLDLIDWAQRSRKRLSEVESTATEFAGTHLAGVGKTGTMADGRTYEVRRGQNRKEWDHDGWKHDARAAVLRARKVPALVVDPIQGDVINLLEVLADVQEVHGSSAPKVTVLKRLELDPDDYCATSPGRWGVTFTDPVQENS